ncbi:hypothetical protein [Bosea psychrotolerans]|uniref:Uncharacterized protein n=1 Tax=Bosea psychrotolerans TaxID=1871628 RepID=A0A2S4LT90_9HYPH|nr:hypothetical protein [Bosea psychrotolerans]POR45569.1 hypothetical protein CYD53_13227 [Bosea psychrotolerans]
MSRWYRAYAGTVKDDKLAEVAVIAACSRSVAIAVWHALLESAAETDDGGRFETTPRRVAAALCEPAGTIAATFAAMAEIGMITGDAVSAWKTRQYESDRSTERSRRHREAKHRDVMRNGQAALPGRCATLPESEAESETQDESAGAASSAPRAPDLALDEAQRRCCEAAGSQRLGSFAPIAEWLHRGADLERDILPVIRARPASGGRVSSWKFYGPIIAEALLKRSPAPVSQGPPKVFVVKGTAEWRERVAAGHKPGMTTQHPRTKAEGWYFPAPEQQGQAAKDMAEKDKAA